MREQRETCPSSIPRLLLDQDSFPISLHAGALPRPIPRTGSAGSLCHRLHPGHTSSMTPSNPPRLPPLPEASPCLCPGIAARAPTYGGALSRTLPRQSSSSRSLVLTSPFQIPTCPLSGFRDPPSREQLSGLTPPGCLLPFSQDKGVVGSRIKEFWGNWREKHQHNHHKTMPEAAAFGTSLSLRSGRG